MTKSLGFEPSGNSRSHSKSFGLSMPFMRSKSSIEESGKKLSLSQIKLNVELSFQDIDGQDAERLRYKVRGAREVKELWMLRSDIHQLISRRFSQQEAAQRINALLPSFEHWIPTHTRVKI
jgi:predicted component of type VI protein secretion system